jgi:5'(3')-deoxyribonucleotidase
VCEEGKKEWLKKHNIYDTFDSIIIENDKSKYADSNKNNILIDDTPKKVDGFKSSGGTAILHKNTVNTIKELSNLIK